MHLYQYVNVKPSSNASNRSIHARAQGSALLWSLIFIVGLSSIGWVATQVVMPQFEKKQRSLVLRALTSVNRDPVNMRIEGFTATLRGEVLDDSTRQAMIDAVDFRTGVFKVNDNLRVLEQPESEPEQALFSADELFAPFLRQVMAPASEVVQIPLRPIETLPEQSQRQPEVQSETQIAIQNESQSNNDPQTGVQSDAQAEIETEMQPPSNSERADTAPTEENLELSENIDSNADSLDGIQTETEAVTQASIQADSQADTQADVQSDIAEPVGTTAEAIDETAQAAETVLQTLSEPTPANGDESLSTDLSQNTLTQTTNDQPQPGITRDDTASLSDAPADSPEESSNSPEDDSPTAMSTLTETPAISASDNLSVSEASSSSDDAITQSPSSEAPSTQSEVRSEAALQQALNALPSLQVRFESGSDVLTQASTTVLDAIAAVLVELDDARVTVEGHTDSTGRATTNMALSVARAVSVREYLIERGVPAPRLQAEGFGEQVPIADNATPQGRATNRRIEFNF